MCAMGRKALAIIFNHHAGGNFRNEPEKRRHLRRQRPAWLAQDNRTRLPAYVRHVWCNGARARPYWIERIGHAAVRRSRHAAVPSFDQAQDPRIPGFFLRLHRRLCGNSAHA